MPDVELDEEGRLGIDLTTVGLIPDGQYQGVVNKVEYQVKSGEKWNKDGITTCATIQEWNEYPLDTRRIHLTIALAGQPGNMFHDLYMMQSALPFTKQFVQAAGVEYTPKGFKPDDLLGKTLLVTVTNKDKGDGYGPQAQYKFNRL